MEACTKAYEDFLEEKFNETNEKLKREYHDLGIVERCCLEAHLRTIYDVQQAVARLNRII